MAKMKVPPALRLRLQCLYFWHRRHFWFAHYADCAHFAPYLLRWGNWRICRGCLLFWSGGVTTALVLAGLMYFNSAITAWHWWLTAMAALMLATIVEFFFPMPDYSHRLLRFAGGSSWAIFFVWTAATPPTWFKLLWLFLAWIGYRRASVWRRRVMKDPCPQCRDYAPTQICPGFAAKIEMERAYQSKANACLERSLLLIDNVP